MIFHSIECLKKAKESLDSKDQLEFDPNDYTKIEVKKPKEPYIIIDTKEQSPNPNHFPPNLYTTKKTQNNEYAYYQYLPVKEKQQNYFQDSYESDHYIDFHCEDGEPAMVVNMEATKDVGFFKDITFNHIKKFGWVLFSRFAPHKCTQPYMAIANKKTFIAEFYLPTIDETNEKYLEKARNQAIAFLKYNGIRTTVVALGAKVNKSVFENVYKSLLNQYPKLTDLLEDKSKLFYYSTNQKVPDFKNGTFISLNTFLGGKIDPNSEEIDIEKNKINIPSTQIITTNIPEYPDFSNPISASFSHCMYYQEVYSKFDHLHINEKTQTIAFLELGYSKSLMYIASHYFHILFLPREPGAVTFDYKRLKAGLVFYSRDYDSPMANANAIVASFRSSRFIVIPIRSTLITHLIRSFDCAIQNWKKFSLFDSFYHSSGVHLILCFNISEENEDDQSEIEESMRLMTLYFYQHDFFSSLNLHYVTSTKELNIRIRNLINNYQPEKIDKENIMHSIAAFATTNKYAEYLDLTD